MTKTLLAITLAAAFGVVSVSTASSATLAVSVPKCTDAVSQASAACKNWRIFLVTQKSHKLNKFARKCRQAHPLAWDTCTKVAIRRQIRELRQDVIKRFYAHGILKVRNWHNSSRTYRLWSERRYWLKKDRMARHLPSGPRAFVRWDNWMCIHSHEGGWTMTPPASGGPYWGGLQMDRDFMNTYGPEYVRMWGYASNWPPFVQVLVAERAFRTRGYNPWPQTARMCGLL